MSKLQLKHAGIILAAGASSRMGQAKASLETPSGLGLALFQASLLMSSGIEEVFIVLGHDGGRIEAAIQEQLGSSQELSCGENIRVIQNPRWESGRVTSIQAGLAAANAAGAVGAFVLPVDTIGIYPLTIETFLERVEITPATAVRPVYSGKAGKALWISTQLTEDVGRIVPSEGVRFDDWIADKLVNIDVEDSAVLNNVNTMKEWEVAKKQLSTFKQGHNPAH